MSSAASRPPHSASQSVSHSASQSTASATDSAERTATDPATESVKTDSDARLSKPPSRSLLKPPARPKPPVAPVAPPPAAAATPVKEAPPEPEAPKRPGPISLPSEPMQYRAIGLLKGKYIASEEQFNRGDIAAEDGTLVDAVLLGRVTSLIKKHIDLEQNHLWVVYPRTLYKEEEEGNEDSKVPALHVQIVGVWEPETLNADAMAAEDEMSRPLSSEEAMDQCDQFSVRGEIAKYSEEDSEILVHIVQKSKSETTKAKKPFKLLINGQLTGRTVGYFWELDVERQAGKLILQSGKSIAVVPPKRKPKGERGAKRRPPMGGGKPRGSAGAPKPKPKPKAADGDAKTDTKADTNTEVMAEAAVETASVES